MPPIYITENGAAVADEIVDGEVHDQERIDYYDKHLNADDANVMDFDKAYEEATLVDKLEKRKQIDE